MPPSAHLGPIGLAVQARDLALSIDPGLCDRRPAELAVWLTRHGHDGEPLLVVQHAVDFESVELQYAERLLFGVWYITRVRNGGEWKPHRRFHIFCDPTSSGWQVQEEKRCGSGWGCFRSPWVSTWLDADASKFSYVVRETAALIDLLGHQVPRWVRARPGETLR